MSRTQRRRSRFGFTLIEVLLVLIILVILGSLAGVSYFQVQKQALEKQAKVQVGKIDGAVKLYLLNMNTAPAALDALNTQPSDDKASNWKGPYFDGEIPTDPWGNDYQYEATGAEYKIWSMGPDATSGTDDDING